MCLAGYFRAGFLLKIENRHRVRAFVQPAAGNVIRLLRTDLPDAANGVAIDPKQSFPQLAYIEEGIADFGEGEGSAMECRRWNCAA